MKPICWMCVRKKHFLIVYQLSISVKVHSFIGVGLHYQLYVCVFQDNKDLGLDQYNLNYETPTLKVTGKTVHEVKIQNVQDNVRSKMENQNNSVQNKVANGINPTAAGPNVNDQLQAHSQPSTQKPGQERKLSSK